MGKEEVHFNLNQRLKWPGFDNVECKIVEQVIHISLELIYDRKIQNLISDNEINFQYIEALNVEYLNSSL